MIANRRSIAFGLLALWVGACAAPWLPWLSWKLNQQALAERYCENRQRPELRCNGQCFLAKQLRAAEDRPAAQATSVPLEFGWIGGLLPLDNVHCPTWADEPASERSLPRNWPLPRSTCASPDPPPPWA